MALVADAVGQIDVLQDAFAIDNEQRTLRAVASVVDQAVRPGCRELGVCQVGKVQTTKLIGELAVRIDIVGADRNDLSIELLELLVVRPKGGQLAGSATGIVSRVKRDEDFAAPQTLERDDTVPGRRQIDLGRIVADAESFLLHTQPAPNGDTPSPTA